MGTLIKIKKPARKVAKSPPSAPKLKFPEGHPFAGIESAFGSVCIPVPPPGLKRRTYLRARILADHNT